MCYVPFNSMFWYGKVLESLFFLFDHVPKLKSRILQILNKWSKFRSNTGVDGNELDINVKKNVNKCVDFLLCLFVVVWNWILTWSILKCITRVDPWIYGHPYLRRIIFTPMHLITKTRQISIRNNMQRTNLLQIIWNIYQ